MGERVLFVAPGHVRWTKRRQEGAQNFGGGSIQKLRSRMGNKSGDQGSDFDDDTDVRHI